MIIFFLSFLNVFYSYCLSYLVENFKRLTNVFLVIILFLLIGLLKEFINFVKNRMLLKYQIKTDKLITIPSLKKIINLPHKFYQERSVGELMAKINDLSYVKQMSFLITEVLFVNVIVMSVSFIFLLCQYHFMRKSDIFENNISIYLKLQKTPCQDLMMEIKVL